ncbi:hypothetical protein K490DRAFT_58794 [Saccharata proteae CBS 121410]|uniref:Uncharacterized protein n=1 Tax=Saccharata proteae CBS 121410 TaxID=1314787 RepID=A0A9P4HSW1_9PEZI|nr:hypothetical protein K490DRAFT_58794 [Saccharata proteae CBS 121410]
MVPHDHLAVREAASADAVDAAAGGSGAELRRWERRAGGGSGIESGSVDGVVATGWRVGGGGPGRCEEESGGWSGDRSWESEQRRCPDEGWSGGGSSRRRRRSGEWSWAGSQSRSGSGSWRRSKPRLEAVAEAVTKPGTQADTEAVTEVGTKPGTKLVTRAGTEVGTEAATKSREGVGHRESWGSRGESRTRSDVLGDEAPVLIPHGVRLLRHQLVRGVRDAVLEEGGGRRHVGDPRVEDVIGDVDEAGGRVGGHGGEARE